MAKKNPLKIVVRPPVMFGGKLHPVKPLATGLFTMHDTYGFPLMMSIVQCDERGLCPDLFGFVADAEAAGWPRQRALTVAICGRGQTSAQVS